MSDTTKDPYDVIKRYREIGKEVRGEVAPAILLLAEHLTWLVNSLEEVRSDRRNGIY